MESYAKIVNETLDFRVNSNGPLFKSQMSDRIAIIAFNDNDVIGGITGTIGIPPLYTANDSDMLKDTKIPGDTPISDIITLTLSPEFKGLGIGHKLLVKFEVLCKNTIIAVGSTKHYNYQFYEKHNYHKVATWLKKDSNNSYLYMKCNDNTINESIKVLKYIYKDI
jgi:ribosomal protein S18 acetylase RimI-like enzyme